MPTSGKCRASELSKDRNRNWAEVQDYVEPQRRAFTLGRGLELRTDDAESTAASEQRCAIAFGEDRNYDAGMNMADPDRAASGVRARRGPQPASPRQLHRTATAAPDARARRGSQPGPRLRGGCVDGASPGVHTQRGSQRQRRHDRCSCSGSGAGHPRLAMIATRSTRPKTLGVPRWRWASTLGEDRNWQMTTTGHWAGFDSAPGLRARQGPQHQRRHEAHRLNHRQRRASAPSEDCNSTTELKAFISGVKRSVSASQRGSQLGVAEQISYGQD